MKSSIALMIAIVPILFASFWQLDKNTESRENVPQIRNLDPTANIPMCKSGLSFNFNFSGDTTQPMAARLDGLGDIHFEVSTESDDAQYFFNQGLRLAYAFNHEEAHRSFMEAARLDPQLAMAYWGQAYVLGPNINDPLPDMERHQIAYRAAMKAQSLKGNATAMEAALIDAVLDRCTNMETEQQALNLAYQEAMARVYDNFGENPDVAILYAAANMNTMPWDYYDKNKQPRPLTVNTVDALEEVIANYPRHPGGHHYYIHIIEAIDPDRAIPSADVLAELMPAAGHIVHMPAHIYIATGHYDKAAETNRQAIEVDEDYIANCQAQGVYPLVYYPHNLHFLWAASSMLGDSEEAIEAGEKVADKIPRGLAADLHFLQDFLAVPLQAYVRFGKWDEILTTPNPGADVPHTRMMWHYARGMAFARQGRTEEARRELELVKEIAKDPASEELFAAYNNPTSEVGEVAISSLAGEIEAADGNYEEAIRQLREAVVHEADLVYQEPRAWHAPARHFLGAVLMEAGRAAEAEEVYRADLEDNRGNGWALFGLYQSLEKQGKSAEAKKVKMEFEKAWAHADVNLKSTRY